MIEWLTAGRVPDAVTAGQSVYIDLGGGINGGSYLPWQLVNDTTGAVISSRNGIVDGLTSPDTTIRNLAAGAYRLIVADNGLAGTYSLKLFTVPDPQVFDLGALSSSPVPVSNGVPATGAGNLETKASQDQYTFTLGATGSIQVHPQACPSGSLAWALVDDVSGTQVAAGSCFDQRVNNLPAGSYRLKMSVVNEKAGTYSFQIFVVPASQFFDLGVLPSAPVSVANGVPAAGAGNLETVASQDEYRFTVTSGQSVYLDLGTGVNGGSVLPWQLVNDSTGALVTSGNSLVDRTISSLAAGAYRLIVADNGLAGIYSLKLFTVPDPQVFDLGALTSSGVSVSNGVPTTGAGNLETKASQDQYTLTLGATSSIYLHALTCGAVSTTQGWTIVNDSTGVAIGTPTGCSDQRVNNLPAGTYRLKVSVASEKAGTYSFQVLVVPPTQVFELGALPSSPVPVSNGVPAAGAGNLETVASQDEYRFTVTAGQSVYVDLGRGVNGGSYLPWTLVNDITGATITSFNGIVDGSISPDRTVSNLAAGTYRIVVADNGLAGTYSMNLFTVPNPQVFDLGALTSTGVSVSNGVPASGAGNLETKASQDQYTFTLGATSSIYLHTLSCGSLSTAQGWTIVNDATGAAVSTPGGCFDQRVNNLPAGSYRLKVSAYNEKAGVYSFQLLVVPPSQVFDLGALTSSPVSVANGVPAAGAGNLETVASQDEYRFTVTAGQSVFLDLGTGVNGGSVLPWQLVNDSTGALVTSGNSLVDRTISNLAAGCVSPDRRRQRAIWHILAQDQHGVMRRYGTSS